ncbi:MAG: hypothetical protein ACEPO8_06210 [Rhodothermaceae bacterium]
MISKLKHSELFKWTLRIWLILFFGFIYIQYSNIHTHSFNGRFITHSHLESEHSESQAPCIPVDKSADHSHTQKEFLYYSILATILATILVVAVYLLLFGETDKIIKKAQTFDVFEQFYCNASLRAPPVL